MFTGGLVCLDATVVLNGTCKVCCSGCVASFHGGGMLFVQSVMGADYGPGPVGRHAFLGPAGRWAAVRQSLGPLWDSHCVVACGDERPHLVVVEGRPGWSAEAERQELARVSRDIAHGALHFLRCDHLDFDNQRQDTTSPKWDPSQPPRVRRRPACLPAIAACAHAAHLRAAIRRAPVPQTSRCSADMSTASTKTGKQANAAAKAALRGVSLP